MAQEQTAYAGDDIKVLVNVIGSTGSHVAAVINTTTTRLSGLSAAPTVTTVATGIYQIVFSGVTPAPAEGDRYTCKVNGSIAGTAWSEYGIPVKIVADERGTDNVTSGGGSGGLDAAGVRAALGLSSANLDTQLGDLPTTSEFNARTLASADYFDFANDTVTTDTASRDASKADIAAIGTNVTAVKAKTDQMVFTNANELDVNAVTGGGGDDAATIYTYFTASSREDSFKADLTGLNDISASDVYTHFTTGANEDAFKADVTALAGVATNVTAVKAKTDQMVFTNANELDVNAVTGGGGDDAATIYTYFTASSREDSFKADVTALAGVATNVTAVKAKTDQMVFTNANELDVNAVTGGGGDDAATIYTYFTASSREDSFKADVTALSGVATNVTAVKAKTDQMVFTNANELDVNAVTGGGGDDAATIYTYFTASSREDSFKADVAALSGVATNVTAVKAKTDQMVFTNANELDVNAVTGGTSPSDIYLYFTASSREDSFKADLTGLNDISASDVYTHFTTGANEDAFKADVAALAGVATNVTAVKSKTDQMVFTNANELDVNAVTGGTSPSDIYLYFTASSREDSFKADLTELNDISASDVYTHFTTGANEDAFKADVTLLATESILSDVKAVTEKIDTALIANGSDFRFTVDSLANAPVSDNAAAIYSYFADASRPDLFKADVSDVIRKGVSHRYTNNGGGVGFDDVTVTDTP